jgi:hypothetical protein
MTSKRRHRPLKQEQKDFQTSKDQLKLGGMWKGIKFSDEDISEVRRELWRKIER